MRKWLAYVMRWPEHSQRGARRNAQRAAVELAESREARESVDREVDDLLARRGSGAPEDRREA